MIAEPDLHSTAPGNPVSTGRNIVASNILTKTKHSISVETGRTCAMLTR
jgi:hypothetical protein